MVRPCGRHERAQSRKRVVNAHLVRAMQEQWTCDHNVYFAIVGRPSVAALRPQQPVAWESAIAASASAQHADAADVGPNQRSPGTGSPGTELGGGAEMDPAAALWDLRDDKGSELSGGPELRRRICWPTLWRSSPVIIWFVMFCIMTSWVLMPGSCSGGGGGGGLIIVLDVMAVDVHARQDVAEEELPAQERRQSGLPVPRGSTPRTVFRI